MRARAALLVLSSLCSSIVGGVVGCGRSADRAAFGEDVDPNRPGFADAGDFGNADAAESAALDRDPVTCAEAEAARSYVGCDYWPTVTANIVADVYDFAVAVANVGTEPAHVGVVGPDGVDKQVTVDGGSIGKIYLPWVAALKGPALTGISQSVMARASAYHLVSDRPVVVYQFNPLQFRAEGGEPGKDWSNCKLPGAPACYSYTNDASLLLPSTAMTGAYRVMGSYGWSRHPLVGNQPDPSQPLQPGGPPFMAVTATQDGTTVEFMLGPRGRVVAGGEITAAPAGGTLSLSMNAGDVAEVVSGMGKDYDFSGSLVIADKPVQLITGVPCQDFPLDTLACDHIEETVFPAETLGKHYVVTTPTGPKGNLVGHVVRLFGNADGTQLAYTPSKPPGCPDTLAGGQVADCGVVTSDFEVSGDKEFGVAMFMLGGAKVDPDYGGTGQPQGDPSQSFAVTVEQYRRSYVFLAPRDYKTSFVDVIASEATDLTIDGADASAKLSKIGGTNYFLARVELGPGNDGVHTLSASKPVGIQVMGYGDNTSYQYPGGLNLGRIAPTPQIPK